MKPNLTLIKPTHTPQRQAAYDASEYPEGYDAALALVAAIEPDPRIGRLSGHFRAKDGRLLKTLNEVVQAILDDDLAGVEADPPTVEVERPFSRVLIPAA